MPRSRVTLLSWVVAGAFALASALVLVDRFHLLGEPPPGLDNLNLVDRMVALAPFRQSIWPVFLWTNLLFAVGYVAAVAFAAVIAAASGRGRDLATFRALVATGGIVGAIASIIPIGAVQGTVWQQYCDCGFKETEVVAGLWAQIVAEDVGSWLNRAGSIILAVALFALARDARGLLSPTLRTWTQITALALIVWPVLATIELIDPAFEEWIALGAGAVLVPVWAVWLGRSVDRSVDSMEAAPA